jgi:hypothetical protein
MYEGNQETPPSVVEPQVQQVEVKEKGKFNFLKVIIPVLVVCLVAVIGIGIWGWYKASSFVPYRVMVSNVTAGSATVSWITEEPTPGMVMYQERNFILPFMPKIGNSLLAYDDRDYTKAELDEAQRNSEKVSEEGSSSVDAGEIFTDIVVTDMGEYYVHHATIRGLESNKEYYFMIGDGNVFKRVSSENTGEYSFKTGKEIEEIRTPEPAYGVVRYYVDDVVGYERPSDAIVYATVYEEIYQVESEMISSITNEEGGWYLDIMNAYMEDGTTFWDSVKDYEGTYIKLKLTIENTWKGRWSTEIDVYNKAPAKAIDMRMDDELDESVIYEGNSFGKENKEVVNTNKDFNGIDLRAFVFGVSAEDTDGGDNNQCEVCSDSRLGWGDPDCTPKFEPSNDGGYCLDPLDGSCTDPIDADINEQIFAGSNGRDTSGGQGSVSCELGSCFNDACTKKIDGVDIPMCKRINVSGLGTFDVFTSDCEINFNRVQGTCVGDICGHMGMCGYSNSQECDCACANEQKPIGPAQMCLCTPDGRVKVHPDTEDKYTDELRDRMADEADSRGLCGGFNTGTTRDCYSYTYKCWFSDGYVTIDGSLKCNGETKRWGIEGHEYGISMSPDEGVGIDAEAGAQAMPFLQVPPADNLSGKECDGQAGTLYHNADTGMYYHCDSIGAVDRLWAKFKENNAKEPDPEIQKILDDMPYASASLYPIVPYVGTKALTVYTGSSLATTAASTSTSALAVSQAPTIYITTEAAAATTGVGLGTAALVVGGVVVATILINEFTAEEEWVPITQEKYESMKATQDRNFAIKTYIEDFGVCGSGSGRYTRCSIQNTNEDKSLSFESKGFSILGKVFAEETEEFESYIINTKEDILERVGRGVHIFNVNGDYYLAIINDTDSKGADVYLDSNGNGIIDSGDTNLSKDFETLEVITIQREYRYDLKKGFNLISFPFINERSELNKASGLIKYLNSVIGNSVSSISKLENGKWISVGANAGNYDQNDFRILPGEGYLLNVKKDIRVSLFGKEIKYEQIGDSAPILLIPGWNLVGVYGSKAKSYTAKSLLEDIANYKGIDFDADNVTRWQESKGSYEGFQRDTSVEGSAQTYGFDFPIEKQRSYFVRVIKGVGNWHPSVR